MEVCPPSPVYVVVKCRSDIPLGAWYVLQSTALRGVTHLDSYLSHSLQIKLHSQPWKALLLKREVQLGGSPCHSTGAHWLDLKFKKDSQHEAACSTDRRREVVELRMELPGRRKIGRPHGSFMDVVKEDIKIIGVIEE